MGLIVDCAGNLSQIGIKRNHQHKLVTTVANGKGLSSQQLPDPFGCFFQYPVSEFVTTHIIHLLKVIDIDNPK